MTLALAAPRLMSRPLQGAERAASVRQQWQELGARCKDSSLDGLAGALRDDVGAAALLDLVFAHSPFLTDCILRDPATLSRLFVAGPDAALTSALALSEAAAAGDKAGLMRGLRRARRAAALTIGLADIGGAWTLDQVTGSLSELAETTLDSALTFLLQKAAERGEIVPRDPAAPLAGCGYVVLGMGKLGACELNYSSDIDLIVLFDPARLDYHGRRDVGDFCIRLTQDLIAVMSERTADGYVFRTDLRLRPDPGATPVAISYGAAMAYYESMGQNWERAAMIKARPVAGDHALGQAFLTELTPFIWRKSLDFLAIQDIHSIKRQIYAHKGGATIAIEGHNVKLGRGGIREIEFFAQTQQLIWGGRDPSLRAARTQDALEALAAAGHTPSATATELYESYEFLRGVEHRLQMRADQQTHVLPDSAEGIASLAEFLGYEREADFRQALLKHFHRVEDHYAHLFEEAPSLAGPGNLVFTGAEPEPATMETLTELGFASPATVFNLVRSWHHGRHRATRSTRARELLTGLMPTLLQAFGRTADPDAALARFDGFLAGLPAGVQLFALLVANPRLLDLIAEVMGTAPGLAEQLTRRPSLLDAVLTPGFFGPLPDREALRHELTERLALARDLQDRLDIVRRFAHDHRFRAGVQLLQGLIDESRNGHFLSNVADAILRALLLAVQDDFARVHGRLPGSGDGHGGLAVLAMGKLGSREMTAGSDLDLVLLYEAPSDAASDGAKPLDAASYFIRLSQRLINALTVQTAEGALYQVDMRLRPSGNAGPLAVTLSSFRRYHEAEAWTWEHMALTRARPVAGPAGLVRRIEETVRALLTRPRDPARLLLDVAAMRWRISRDKPAAGPWDVKLRRGGLVDCEFLAQYLQLAHAHTHPDVLAPAPETAFARLAKAGLMAPDAATLLTEATRLWRQVQGYLRLTLPANAGAVSLPPAIHQGLARATGSSDFETLAYRLDETAARVSLLFDAIIGNPGAELAEQKDGQSP